MRLALKLIFLVLVAIILISGLNGYLRVRREIGFFHTEVRQGGELLGRTLPRIIADTWQSSHMDRVRRVIQDANRADRTVAIRWVWLDAEPGDPDAPAVPDARLHLSAPDSVVRVAALDSLGERHFYTYYPVDIPTPHPAALEIRESLKVFRRYTRRTITRVIILTLVLVLTSALIVSVIGINVVGRPLRRIIERAREIGAGQLSGRIEMPRADELGELAEAINGMSAQLLEDRKRLQAEMEARIEALEQLRHADRLRTVGRLASGIAHELGTPLNVVSGHAGLIAADESATPAIVDGAGIIRAQCTRMTTIIRQLLDFARAGHMERVPTDLGRIVSETATLFRPLAEKRNVKIQIGAPEAAPVAWVDPGQLRQILANLLMNAVQALPERGTVVVRLDRRRARPPRGDAGADLEYGVIEIRDDGVGISAEDLPHVFEPFFTTKDVGEGTGLGLSIAYGIAREHGGWIDVSSEPGHGTCFTVFLPLEEVHARTNPDCG